MISSRVMSRGLDIFGKQKGERERDFHGEIFVRVYRGFIRELAVFSSD